MHPGYGQEATKSGGAIYTQWMPRKFDLANLPELDPRVLDGIDCFNRGEYFEAHEVIEGVWLEEFTIIRPLYQGLIQAAVCLYHLERKNRHGAVKLYRTCREHMAPFGEVCKGIHVGKLIRDLDELFEPILKGREHDRSPLPKVMVDGSTRSEVRGP